MTKIIDNNELEVVKLQKKIKFKIKNNKFTNFYQFIKKILNKKTNSFTLEGKTIIGLNDLIKSKPLSYRKACTLFQSLFLQIQDLQSHNLGVLYFDLSDIYFIEISDDEFYFLLLKTDKIKEINNDNLEILETLPKKSKLFFSPELKSLKSFPKMISFKTIYYSLALITLHTMKKITGTLDIENHIESLKETPLYWALQRCLVKNVENRTLLYI